MGKIIHTEIIIHATPAHIWPILTDFKSYPDWNPFVKAVEGEVKRGNRIKVLLQPPNGKSMTFRPKVLAFEKDQELRWLGNLLFRGIFDGEHVFRLTPNPDGTTTFTHSETFGGILVPLMKKQLDNGITAGFRAMNASLKALAEKSLSKVS